MARPGGPVLPALFLVVITIAGLNIHCASSTTATASSTASPSSIFTSGGTESGHVATTPNNSTLASTIPPTTPTVPLRTTLAEQTTIRGTIASDPKVETSVTTPLSRTSSMSISTAPQAITGLQSTEHGTWASVTSVASAKPETFTHSQTLAFSSSQSSHESSTIIAPPDITKPSTAEVTQLPSTETSAPVVTSKKVHTIEATSGKIHVSSTSSGPLESLTSSEVTITSKVSQETSHTEGTTFSAGITVQEVQRALSPGSIAAITITVIAVVLLVFGIAAFLKIRHSSYGRLFDDHDYGSWGNYNNPLYDDS